MELKGKHVVEPIDGERCTVVEKGLSVSRKDFLLDLLEHNGYTVKTEQEKDKEGKELGTWMLGVTDLIMNPVIVLYLHKLFRKDGKVVTPAYWREDFKQADVPYWQVKR